jgi:hypothetical protein
MRKRRPVPKPEDLLKAKAAGWERRRRALLVLSLSLDGLMISLAACVMIAFVAQLFPLPIHPAFLSGALVVLGFLICGGIGAFRPSDASASLLAADRRLGLKERLSTAYELLRSRRQNPFTAVLAADAASRARDIKGKDVHRLPAPKRWRVLPLLAAALLVVLLVDFGLPSPLIGGRDPELAEQGRMLEDLGKRLASRAARDFLPETLRLAEEMERLGNELQRGQLDRDEAADQLKELADQAEERAREMQQQTEQNRQPGDGSPGDGEDYTSVPLTPGGPGEGEDGETVQGFMDSEGSPGGPPGQQMPPDFGPPGDDAGGGPPGASRPDGSQPDGSGTGSPQSDPQSRQEIDNLNELEEALRDSAQQLAMADTEEQGGSAEEEPSEGDSSDPGSGITMRLGDTESEEPPGGAPPGGSPGGPSPGTRNEPGEPGTEAVQDEAGETGGFAGLSREETSEIESTPDEGDTLRGILRALPLASSAQKPVEEVIVDYSRQLEENIEREAVPLNFRQYIRDYFVIIGILGKATE